MPEPIKVVAVLAANPALTSISAAVLAATPGLRVRSFESQIALTTYMRLSTVDLLVCDFDCEASPAGMLARTLRDDAAVVRREFQIIALAGAVDEDLKAASISSGIDEVIVKPMSPKYLLERVLSRLKRLPAHQGASPYAGPERRRRPATPREVLAREPSAEPAGSNVVQLFKHRPLPVN